MKDKIIILKLLEETGSITLHELVNFCNVSEATIRRDLTTLEEKNLLYRTHGGAVNAHLHVEVKKV